MGVSIQFKRHIANSTVPSVVLAEGEPLYMKATNRLYIGDGSTIASNLMYVGMDIEQQVTTLSETLTNGMFEPLKSTNAEKLVGSGGTTALDVGSGNRPVYFSGGVPTQGYYIPKLNGFNWTSSVSFYAPQSGGTAGQVLVSNGSSAPTWVNQNTLVVSSASNASNALHANTADTATTATNVATLTNDNTGANTTIAFSIGNKSYSKTITVAVPSAVDYSKQLYESGTSNPHDGSYYLNYSNLTNKPTIPNPTDYYWANVKISSSASGTTSPTFGSVSATSVSAGSLSGMSLTLNGKTTGGIKDNASATALTSTTDLVTQRTVYYALPSINGNKTYTSSSTIYAPTDGGTTNYVLKSNGSSAPTWVAQSSLTSGKSNAVKIGSNYYSLSFSNNVLSFTSL